MDPKGQALLKLLFNEDESICVHPNKFSYHSIPRNSAMEGRVTLVSKDPDQPIRYCDSSELILVAINPMQGFRQDSSATKFRSFLWEIDAGSIKEQRGYLDHIGVPTSARIFSGNKSVHAITVLDEDLNEKTWRELCIWALRILTMCDQACKNPSRSVRIPGAYREPGKKQRLIGTVGERVKVKDFMAWLNKYPHLRPMGKEKKLVLTGQADYSRLSPWARSMMVNGVTFNNRGRNQTWYGLAYDMALAGYSEDRGTELLLQRFTEEDDFKEKELLTTIASAFKKVSEGK